MRSLGTRTFLRHLLRQKQNYTCEGTLRERESRIKCGNIGNMITPGTFFFKFREIPPSPPYHQVNYICK